MEPVKFVALDRDDLEVVSTHLQDALVKVADVIWRPAEKRLVVALSLPNPITEQFAAAGVWPPGHEILVRLLPAVGVGVLYHGLRSRGLKALWRKLQHAA